MNTEQARFNMIEQQIRPWEVLDSHVLQLLALVKREDFVPPQHKALAFVDMELPIGEGQVMLAPKVEARLLQDLQVQRHESVLEIGAGSGFMAALLGHRARSVLSLELHAPLAAMARANLRRAGLHNVDVRHADGAAGAPQDGPFDVILLSGSVARIPQVLLDQLSIGGRLMAIVGTDQAMQAVLVTRSSPSAWQRTAPWDTVAPALQNFAHASAFVF
ncbi:MAG: protein-L-isoaspartate O-methyltransferase family protein [Burkholderiaceae bacterium]